MNASIGAIQNVLLSVSAIVGEDRHIATHTNQELVACAMCMLAPGFDAGNIEYEKIALRGKWNRSFELAHAQAAANIGHTRQLDETDAVDAR